MPLIVPRNDALSVNPPDATLHLSTNGSNWLWAVVAIYGFSICAWIGLAFISRKGLRVFHYLFLLAAFTGALAYFAMASGLGNTPVFTEMNRGGDSSQTRSMWYARYINWFICWPILTMSILLVSGVSWVTIIFSVAMSGFWVVAWISASLVTTVYRWGFFVFGVVAFFVLAYQIGFAGMKQARGFSTDRYYLPIAYGAIFIWLVYPIAWGLDEGGNKITVTSGLIFYSILDIIQIPVFGTFFIYYSRCWDLKALGLDYTQHGRIHGDRVNGGDHEKSAQASGAAEGTNNAGTA